MDVQGVYLWNGYIIEVDVLYQVILFIGIGFWIVIGEVVNREEIVFFYRNGGIVQYIVNIWDGVVYR